MTYSLQSWCSTAELKRQMRGKGFEPLRIAPVDLETTTLSVRVNPKTTRSSSLLWICLSARPCRDSNSGYGIPMISFFLKKFQSPMC